MRGSLGRTDRMVVWVKDTGLRRSMVVSRTAWWRWMLKNWQNHRKGPCAQTSEDAGEGGGYKAHTEGHSVFLGRADGRSTGRRMPHPAR